jgi:nucleoside triphosphate diphosphatase
MTKSVERLVEVMRRLRDPKSGCPWDLAQNFQSIAPHTLEETYEVIEAIEENDTPAMIDELGDLLFQIIFYAQLGSEAKLFDLDLIASRAADKMIERHPHIFAERDAKTAGEVLVNWEEDKALKREAKGRTSALDGISRALPAMLRAVKLQKRAARVGFDWKEARDVLSKIREEIDELEAESEAEPMSEELGDILFSVINLARKLDIEPERALRTTNRKFERRFREIERRIHTAGRKVQECSLQELETLWTSVKKDLE